MLLKVLFLQSFVKTFYHMYGQFDIQSMVDLLYKGQQIWYIHIYVSANIMVRHVTIIWFPIYEG